MKRQPGTAELSSMNLSVNMTSGIGQPVRRKEDFRLLTGRGSFADDVRLPELAHAVIVRSPHAHAHIASVDKAVALTSPGVLAVLIGQDYVADGLAPIPHGAGLMGPRMFRHGFEASARSRPSITRCRTIGPALSANPSPWSWPRPSIKPGTRPS